MGWKLLWGGNVGENGFCFEVEYQWSVWMKCLCGCGLGIRERGGRRGRERERGAGYKNSV